MEDKHINDVMNKIDSPLHYQPASSQPISSQPISSQPYYGQAESTPLLQRQWSFGVVVSLVIIIIILIIIIIWLLFGKKDTKTKNYQPETMYYGGPQHNQYIPQHMPQQPTQHTAQHAAQHNIHVIPEEPPQVTEELPEELPEASQAPNDNQPIIEEIINDLDD